MDKVAIMSCRIISDENGAVFYCSTTMKAFGLVMEDEGEAEDFMMWLIKDPRKFTDQELENKYYEFRELRKTKD